MLRPVELYGLLGTLPPMQGKRLADVLNIKWVLHGEPFEKILTGQASREVKWTERPHPLPRALLLTRWRVIPDWRRALGQLLSPSFNPFKEAVLESATPDWQHETGTSPTKAGPTNSPMESKVLSIHYDWNRCDVEVQADKLSLLLLNDPWYPGWVAKVDGHQRPILRSNVIFRSVMVEPGRHRV